tara:strand:+ start:3401 stop:4894 length:1494 start_codon:yes stop_codon:yes gene_type:complete
MDTINDFINDTIFSDSNESRIGQYGNNVVNLINKFIRIVIAFAIVYLIIIKMPDHGDKDHTMYFNLLLLISIFLILIYIQKNWRGYYINSFLGATDPPIGGECAGDLDSIPKSDEQGNKCPHGIEENGSILIDAVILALTNELSNWKNYFICIGIGLGLRQLGVSGLFAGFVFFPFDCLKGIIFFVLFASKYSPINFLFGKTGSVEDPYIYGDQISETEEKEAGRTPLINFNEKFYLMYIVLILLIFFTIIIRLTSDTIIDCKNFVGPIPLPGDILKGCMGYRFYMVLNVLLFIGFSTDFIDSLQKISAEDTALVCPWKVNDNKLPAPMSEQIYNSKIGKCLRPENQVDPPICEPKNDQIIECKPKSPPPFPGCKTKRDNNNYILKDITQFNESDNNIDGSDHRIIIREKPGGGYIIDPIINKININDSACKKSIDNWLAGIKEPFEVDPITVEIINARTDLTEDVKTELLEIIGGISKNLETMGIVPNGILTGALG